MDTRRLARWPRNRNCVRQGECCAELAGDLWHYDSPHELFDPLVKEGLGPLRPGNHGRVGRAAGKVRHHLDEVDRAAPAARAIDAASISQTRRVREA